ncbi:MAG: type I secretion system permease/ATPase [Gammaproteobacteria bacterium]|nr:type I secretion system permease/ATPase [Gammaproteobacteria bacterium]
MDEKVQPSLNDRETDPLLGCLLIISQYYRRPYSKEALLAGLPLLNNRLTPSLFIRAAERAGFIAKLNKKSLPKISNLVLPAILILQNNQCCVLKNVVDDTAEIILPEFGISNVVHKSMQELGELYSGYMILIKPAEGRKKQEFGNFETTSRSWFWGTLWHFRGNYVEVFIAALFINIFTLVTPLFIMNVYDRVVPNSAMVTLWTLTIGIFIIFAFDLILRFLRSYLIDIAGKKADVLLAGSIFQQVTTIHLRHKPRSVGSFVNNLREFETIRDFFTSATLTTLVDLPFLILFVVLIWYLGSYIVIVPLIAVPLVIGTVLVIQKPLYNAMQDVTQSAGQKQALLVESIAGLEVLKTLNAEGLVQQKWEQIVAVNASKSLRSRFLSGSVTHFANFVQQMVTVAIVIIGVYEISHSRITLGGLIACTILAGRMMAPLTQFTSLLIRYQQAKFALQGLNHLMSLSTEYDKSREYIHRPKIKGDIEFQQVSFAYPGQEANKALIHVSFKIVEGEHVAILGKIGSGKSTIQKLILGLYQPLTGAIYIDGIDVSQLDTAALRQNIGSVPQETLLFTGTVRDNITLAKPWADDREILEAAKLSGTDGFINRHPLGYALPVGERGEGLSGGQRQTIAIARALLGSPPILLLDEPTSSMDDQLESEWINKMKPYLAGKTLVITTHKPALLQLVNRIIILDKGKVVIDGPKEEVLKKIVKPRDQK